MSKIPVEHVYRDIIEYAKQYSVKKVVLFGSRARKTNHEKSDIDIAVYGCRDFDGFKMQVDENLWSLLEIDVINMDDAISEELRNEIKRDEVVLYEEI